MRRLYVLCEGQTEVAFVQEVLREHLAEHVAAPNLQGHRTYSKVRKEIHLLLRSADAVVTTMLDLFKLPQDFPGSEMSLSCDDPLLRVRFLEQKFREDIDDARFVPHLQLHEFEALLMTDLSHLARSYPSRKQAIEELAGRIEKDFPSPEHVNRDMPPSRRILQIVPEYSKTVAGVVTVFDIGLEDIRNKCRHFDAWITSLEHRQSNMLS
jgi:hypothetical protein